MGIFKHIFGIGCLVAVVILDVVDPNGLTNRGNFGTPPAARMSPDTMERILSIDIGDSDGDEE